MFARFLRKLLRSKKAPVKARSRSWPRFVPSFERLEERLNLSSASPTNVPMLYDATAHSLSVSSQQATGSQSLPFDTELSQGSRLINGAVDLNRAVPSAEVWTDKPDYHPNSTAIINGSGFAAGETVELQVLHTDATPSPGDKPWVVTDGGPGDLDGKRDGNIQTTWYVGADCAGATLQLTSMGLTSGDVAQWTFTDSVTVTPATGGTNLSADKAANAASPQYTTLGNIVIAETGGNKADFATGSNKTLILTAPSGWTFNPSAGSVSFATGKDITAASIAVTSTTITVTLSVGGTSNADTLTISGIQVRATNGSALPSSGNILRTSANPGTATINGITNDVTSFAALSQVAGAAAKFGFTTAPMTIEAGVTSSTMTVQLLDQFGATALAGASGQTINLSSNSGTGVFRDTADTTNLTSVAIASGSSTASFKYRDPTPGTPTITAAATGLTSASQVETVQDTVAPTSAVSTPANGASLNALTSISGTASDTVSGVQKLEVSIRRNSDGSYWDGSAFSGTTEVFNLASGTTSWSYAFSLPADGSYTVRSRATDNSGNVETPGAGNTFTIDTVAPTAASVTTPANGSLFRAATVPASFSGSVADNSGGVGLAANSMTFTLQRGSDGLYWTGSAWQAAVFQLAASNSATTGNTATSWTSSATLPTWSSQSDSTYTVQVKATDKAGNTFTGTAVSFTLDKTAPATASVTTPASGSSFAAAAVPASFSGSVADNTGGVGLAANSTTFTLKRSSDNNYWTGSAWQAAAFNLAASNSATTGNTAATWASSATLPTWAAQADGTYTVQVTATDAVGNTFTGTAVSFTLDSTAPATASVTTPAGGSTFRAATVPASFSGSVADNTGGVGLVANSTTFTLKRSSDNNYWTGSAWQAAAFSLAASNNATSGNTVAAWASSATLPTWAAQADGTYTVQATVTDAVGNTFTGTAVSFTLDSTAPATASVTTPAGGSSFGATAVPASFGGSVADNSGGVGLAANSMTFTLQRGSDGWYWTGSAWQAGVFNLAASNSATTGSTAATWTSSATLPSWASQSDGTYTIQATATDKAGNNFTGTAVSFTLDKTAPATASVTTPASGTSFRAAAVPASFSGSIADNTGGVGLAANSATFTLKRSSDNNYWTGSAWQAAVFNLAASNSATSGGTATTWTSSATLPTWASQSDSTYTIQATATDLVGNTFSGTAVSFTLDNTAPTTASDTTPTNGSLFRAATVPTSFSGSVADNSGGVGLNANSTTFTFQRSSDNCYWTGSTWQAAVYNLAATNSATTSNTAATWTSSATLPTWASQSDGTYTIQATATDKAGNTFTGGAVSFTLDNTAPTTASVTTPASGSSFRAATVPATFSGSVADNSGGAGLAANSTTFTLQRSSDNFYWTGSAWQSAVANLVTTHSATTGNTAAAWTDNVTLPTWSSQSDGTYTIQAKATDKAGNTFTGTAVSFTLDKTAPTTASVTTPASGSSFQAAAVPTSFSGSVADNSGGAGLAANSTTFTLKRSSDNNYWTGSTWQTAVFNLAASNSATTGNTAATWTSSASLPTWASQTDGTYTVQATATDMAGNTFTGTAVSFTLDNTAPATASVTTPAGGSSFRAASVPASFSGSVADNSGGVGLNANSTTFTLQRGSDGFYWTGSAWQAAAVSLAATNSATTGNTVATWTSSATLPSWASQSDGTYTVQATATDKDGNSFTGTAVSFTLDSTAPATASVTTPAGGSSYRAATVPASFSGSVADNTGGVGLAANSTTFTLQRSSDNFYWTGSAWQAGVFNLAASNSATTGSTATAWTSSATLPTWSSQSDGTYTIQATATDKAGNSFTGTAVSFTLDKTAPTTGSVTTPASGSSFAAAAVPASFSGSVADNTGGMGLVANSTTFTLKRSSDNNYWTGSAWQAAAFNLAATNGATTGDTAATWTSSATLPTWASQADGTYTVQATATDLVGNSFTGTAVSFTLDNAAPTTATVTSPTSGSSFRAASVPASFSGSVADNSGGGGLAANSATFTLQRSSDNNYWTGSGWQAAVFNLAASNGATTGNTAATWTSSATLPTWASQSDGTYTVQATATDKAGNSFTGTTVSFTLDNTAPAAPSTPDLTAASDSGSSSTDNITNVTTPTFTGTAEAGSTVKIFDGATQVGSGTATGGTYTITTSTLTAGTHSITATATDAAGNVSAVSAALSITMDTAAPAAPSTPDLTAASDSGSSSTDNITNVTTPTFTGTAEANSTVQLFRGGSTLIGTGTANGSGNWTITSSALTDGTYSITAKATDVVGNVSSASGALSITIDTTPPSSAPTTPDMAAASDSGSSSTDNITNVTTPSFSGTVGTSGITVYLMSDGVEVGSASSTGTPGNWTIAASALSEGTHSITAEQRDVAGNVASSAALSITIDTSAPAAPATPDLTAATDSGSSSTDNLTNDTTPAFTGTAESGSTVTLFSDGVQVGSGTAAAYNSPGISTSTLTAGTHNITAKATDAAGNVSSTSAALSVTIDTTGPAVSVPDLIAASDSGSSSTDNNTSVTTPTFSGTAEANSAVVLLEGSTVLGTTTADGSGNWSITSSTLSDGTHSITAKATDAAGNSTTSAALSVTIDTAAPTAPTTPDMTAATDSGSSSTDNLTSNTTPAFTGTAEAGSTVTIFSDGVQVGSGTAASYASAAGITITTALSNGTHSITAKATDAAGNVSALSGALSITIDISAPTATVDAITALSADTGASSTDFITATASQTVSGTFTGTLGSGESIQVSANGGTTWVTATVSGSTWSASGVTLVAGTNTLTTRTIDAAGNTTAGASHSYTLDTTAPAAPSASDLTAASDSGSSNTDNNTNVTTPTFTGTAEAGSTVTIFSDGVQVGSGTATGGTYTITTSVLADGTHSITAKATDTAGNVSTASSGLSVVIDTTAPTVTIGSPSATLTRTGPVTYTVTYGDTNFSASTLSAANLTLNTTGTANATVAVTTVNSTTRTVTLSSITGDGTLGISIAAGTATDLAGNTAPAAGPSATFAVDNTAPTTASVTTPANGSLFRAATVPATFSGSVADNSGGVGLNANSTTFTLQRSSDNLYWTGSAWQSAVFNLATTHSATTGNTAAAWTDNVTLPTWSSQTDGTYTIQAKATGLPAMATPTSLPSTAAPTANLPPTVGRLCRW